MQYFDSMIETKMASNSASRNCKRRWCALRLVLRRYIDCVVFVSICVSLVRLAGWCGEGTFRTDKQIKSPVQVFTLAHNGNNTHWIAMDVRRINIANTKCDWANWWWWGRTQCKNTLRVLCKSECAAELRYFFPPHATILARLSDLLRCCYLLAIDHYWALLS